MYTNVDFTLGLAAGQEADGILIMTDSLTQGIEGNLQGKVYRGKIEQNGSLPAARLN